MPWYGWLLLALFVILALAAVTLRLLRTTRRGRRFLSLSTRAKIDFGRALMEDPSLPLLDKVALGILVGYLALPLDLIPDFIPVIGQLDDFLIVSLAVLLLLKTIPPERFDAAVARAEYLHGLRAKEVRPPSLPPGPKQSSPERRP
jgi:uncharacterized membrane protein YkvA (DUF1232 family)